MNRIGDVFYLLGILISLLLYNSVDILTLISNTYINNDILLFFFFLAAMAKSAQIFLHI
jgi:NADH:ubiquinone oxidoreductase subunit 5 (subunit L)/multisubunit Na+/H+ antiporter MnhA subunit